MPDAFLADALTALADPVFLLDEDLKIGWANTAGAELLGADRDALVGRSALDFVHPDDVGLALDSVPLITRGPSVLVPAPYRLRRAGGTWITVEVFAGAVRGHRGGQPWVGVVARPTTARDGLDRAVDAIAAGRPMAEIAGLLMHAGAPANGTVMAMSWVDSDRPRCVASAGVPDSLVPKGRHWEATPIWDAARASPGHAVGFIASALPSPLGTEPDAIRRPFGHLVAVEDPSNPEPAMVLWLAEFESNGSNAYRLQRVVALTGVALARRHTEQRLEWAAQHDPLTRLLNRAAFFDRLWCAIDRTASPVGLLYLDLDAFKPINDQRGHHAGDAVLRSAADRLQRQVTSAAAVARLGGDEFAVLLPGRDLAATRAIAQSVVESLRQPIDGEALPPGGLSISTSIGVASNEGCSSLSADELVERADAAMYRAKANGGDQWSE